MATRVRTPAPVFPRWEEIPQAMCWSAEEAAARYLIRGEVRPWAGPCQEVMSPIRIAEAEGRGLAPSAATR